MPSLTLGDLSQVFQLRRDTVRVRQDLATATQELASGKKSDLGRALSGNFAPLVGLDRQLASLGGYATTLTEATIFTDAAQTALEQVKTVSGELGLRLSGLTESSMAMVRGAFAAEAEGAFEATVSALNTSSGSRSLFAGAATDRAPLSPAEEMLDELRTMTGGMTTASAVADAVEAWFAPGGGFDAHYHGSDEPISGFQVADGREIDIPIKADDTAFRDQLKGLAMGALLDGSGITDVGELVSLADRAGSAIIANGDNVLSVQARLGSAQARIEAASVQNAAESTALQMARNDIVAVDPYEAATRLQNLQVQLETIYTITARLSGLSLTNYLR